MRRLAILALLLAPATFAKNSDLSGRGILAIAKMAGACGIMDSLIQFQKTTGMPGGDEFVTRFWAVESARLGKSLQDYSAQCDAAISAYERIWNAQETDD